LEGELGTTNAEECKILQAGQTTEADLRGSLTSALGISTLQQQNEIIACLKAAGIVFAP
jgi:hypothetical protein